MIIELDVNDEEGFAKSVKDNPDGWPIRYPDKLVVLTGEDKDKHLAAG